MKNILIFYTPIIEIIDNYSRIVDSIIRDNKNNNIYIVKCEGEKDLKNCISNFRANKHKCILCKSKFDKLLTIHSSVKVINYPLKKSYDQITIKDKQELKNLIYRNINIGLGVDSAMISVTKDHVYSLDDQRIINSIIKTSKLTLDFLFDNKQLNFDEIFVFNGRVSHFNAVVQFCRKQNINYNIFEIVSNKSKYLLLKNSTPHDKHLFSKQLIAAWDKSNNKNKIKIGESFFNKNQHSNIKENNEIDYSSFQKKGKIPKKILNQREIISIFGSSRNETESVEGWENNFLNGDDEEIIFEICNSFKNKFFVYRVHPNLKLSSNTQTKNIKKLNNISNLYLIDSNSNISSYELIELSNKIIVFNSTIGVEATYREKPVISIGPSWTEKIDLAYKPKDMKELKNLLYNDKLTHKPKINAIKFGYFQLTRGKNYNKNSINLDLKINYITKFKILILKIIDILNRISIIKLYKYIYSIRDKRIRKNIFEFFKT